MISRGEIVGINDDGTFKVRCPIYDGKEGAQGSTRYKDLPDANYIAIPGVVINYEIGDIVVVGFENFDYRYPIILGYLGTALNKERPLSTLLVNNITVNNSLTTVTSDVSFNTSSQGDGNVDVNEIISTLGEATNLVDEINGEDI